MKNRIRFAQKRLSSLLAKSLILSSLLASALAIANPARANDFQVSLHRGSVITAELGDQEINWTTVLNNGEMSKRKIKFSDIQKLVLSDAPASQQVAEIRGLITKLESSDYLQRNAAEEKLSQQETGGRFLSLIKAQVENPKFEVRYRIQRILDRLDMDIDEVVNEFDVLYLKDGSMLEGDAGNFKLECQYRDQKFSFPRSDIQLISEPVKPKVATKVASEVKVRMFHTYENEFYTSKQVLVDFNQSPSGSKLKKDTNVEDVFIPMGLKVGTEEENGFVAMSGYPFRFNAPPSGGTICVYKNTGSFTSRFKGIMEFQFCMPNQKSVPAGVHEFGLFMARVNFPRSFLVEAYNADGQILAAVESTDKNCVFGGIKSNELITKIRIIANPYLFRIEQEVDEDYAVDHVCFSPPVPVSNPKLSHPEPLIVEGEKKPKLELPEEEEPNETEEIVEPEPLLSVVSLKNGDSIRGSNLKVGNEKTVLIDMTDNATITIKLDEVRSLKFAVEEAPPKEKKWLAVLKDRSAIFVKPGATMASEKFPNLKFKPNEIAALSSAKNRVRYPEATDFEKGAQVLVFPTCRIPVDKLAFTEEGYSWEKDAVKVQQPIYFIEPEEGEEDQPPKLTSKNPNPEEPEDSDPDESKNVDPDDPTPQFRSVNYAKAWPYTVPTVWTNRPQSQQPGTGQLRLVDGQQLTLSGAAGFEITKIDSNSVTVSVASKTIDIPLNEILSIEFAQ